MVILAIGIVFLACSGFILLSSAASQGYVAYSVSLTNSQYASSKSFVINETVQPATQSGFSIISLALTGSTSNFSISKLVNTTNIPETFPIIPALTNESFSYSKDNHTITGNIQSTGTSPINFGGSSYTGNSYSFFLTVTNSTGSNTTVHGTLLAFPSGLLDSAAILANGSSVTIQLVSTNIPLTYSIGTSAATGTAIVGAGVIGAAALAVPFWTLRRKKNVKQKTRENKPSYWVD